MKGTAEINKINKGERYRRKKQTNPDHKIKHVNRKPNSTSVLHLKQSHESD